MIERMLDVGADRVDAWAAGDAGITDNGATATVYSCFENAAQTFGLDDVHLWFETTNAGLDGATPGEVIADPARRDTIYAAAVADIPFKRTPLEALDRAGQLRVGLAGDWHGNLGHAVGSVRRLARRSIRTLLHLGDFGLWPGPDGAQFIRRLTQECDAHDITIYVTDGNHDDHHRLATIEPVDGVRWISDRIGFHERGRRWDWANTRFVSLGGAPSVDREWRTEGRDWWAGEQITDEDVARAVSADAADVMLSHDAPQPATRAVENIIRHNPQGWPADALTYAAQGRAKLTTTFHQVRPHLLVHGHFHIVDRATVWVPGGHDHPTEVVALARDGMGGNLAILDIPTLQVTIL